MRSFSLLAFLRTAVAAAALCAVPLRAADFDPRLVFALQPLPDGVNVYRSSNGAPGPGYWQNHIDYAIDARIDTVGKPLTKYSWRIGSATPFLP